MVSEKRNSKTKDRSFLALPLWKKREIIRKREKGEQVRKQQRNALTHSIIGNFPLERISDWYSEGHRSWNGNSSTQSGGSYIWLTSSNISISYPYRFISTIMEYHPAVKVPALKKRSWFCNKICKLCFFNAWGTTSRSFFSLVLWAYTG